MTAFDCDVGVIGGGPAGSAIGAYLARAGVRCVVFEKEQFPRFHVGESLVPGANRVLKELGLFDRMEAAGFPRKYGAAWTSSLGRFANMDFAGLPPELKAQVAFGERDMESGRQDYTFHVDRAKFDAILLEHAAVTGAQVRATEQVLRVEFPDHEPVRIIAADPAGSERVTTARVVVDASGRRTLLGRQLGLRMEDPYFNQYALHTWFEDFDRGATDASDYIFIHFLPISSTWVWQIPISATVTSIGVVTQKENFRAKKQEREEFFRDNLRSRPDLYDRLRAARQVRPFTAEADYSYAMRAVCGRGFVLIGDAARFVDPIFSSGVSIALNAARMAAADLIQALSSSGTGVLEADAFRSYETKIHRGTRNWYEFIALYYRLNILFTYFVQDPRYRLDVLKLLQGEVYDDEAPAVLSEMRRVVEMVENNPGHAWHKLLGDLGRREAAGV